MPIIAVDILDELLTFRKERDWEKFHTPKNLSAALSIEAAELLECFLWTKESELEELIIRERTAIEDEIADIAIFLNYLCHDLSIELDVVIRSKIEKNRKNTLCISHMEWHRNMIGCSKNSFCQMSRDAG